MSVVDIDKTKPWTKETGFAVLSIIGIADEDLREMMTPEEFAEYTEWDRKIMAKAAKIPAE